MRIIIVNYRFFISGGPERYMFNIIELLKKNGHEVVPFSVKHNKNMPSEYEEKYFLEPVGSGDEVYGHEYRRNYKTVSRVFNRMVYSAEAKRKIKALIRDFKPDLIYVLQFQNKMSCSVIEGAYEMKVPVVQRISDFAHICIDNIFYQYQQKKVCERCLHGSKLNAIKYKCANDSYVNSAIKVLALKVQDWLNIRQKISAYIIPSKFTVEKFMEFGVPETKITHIPTFFSSEYSPKKINYEDYFLYVGRIDPDKGLLTLVNAFIDTPYRLIVVGSSGVGYDTFLKNYIADKSHNITFTGQLQFKDMIPYLENCLCTVCPSEWYDNFPNAVLESYAFKKAVIASCIGSLKDLVTNNETGLHFEPANTNELRRRVEYMFTNKAKAIQMGEKAFEKLNIEYSPEFHYKKLLEVFNNTVNVQGISN